MRFLAFGAAAVEAVLKMRYGVYVVPSSRLLSFPAIWLLFAALALSCGGDEPLAKATGEACVLNTDCSSPLVCAFRKCHVACTSSRDCTAGQRCVVSDRPFHVCQLVEETQCVLNSDCPEGQVCGVDRECRDQCAGDRDCVEGQLCRSRTCAEPSELVSDKLPAAAEEIADGGGGQPCLYTSECPAPLACIGKLCAVECRSSVDCSRGSECVQSRCARGTGTLIGPEGGVVTVQGGKAQLTIPPHALRTMLAIFIEPADAWPDGAIGEAYQILPNGLVFHVPATLAIRYTMQDLGSVAPQDLAMGQAVGSRWTALPSSVDVASSTVSASLDHLSFYAVIGPDALAGGGTVPDASAMVDAGGGGIDASVVDAGGGGADASVVDTGGEGTDASLVDAPSESAAQPADSGPGSDEDVIAEASAFADADASAQADGVGADGAPPDAPADVATEQPPPFDAGSGCIPPGIESTLSAVAEGLPDVGLALWVRGDRGVYMTAQNRVCAWADQSGNGRLLSNVTTRPLWLGSGLGAQAAIRFDAVGSELGTDALGIPDTAGRTFIAVTQLVSTTGRFHPILQGVVGSSGTYFGIDTNTWQTAGSREGVYVPSSSFDTPLATSTSPRVHVLSASQMVAGTALPDALVYRVNGATQPLFLRAGGGSMGSFTGANFTSIGVVSSTTSTGFYGDALLAEALVYNRALSATEQTAVEVALKARYGIP